jgi:ATP-dependent protease ClpP protease subunit
VSWSKKTRDYIYFLCVLSVFLVCSRFCYAHVPVTTIKGVNLDTAKVVHIEGEMVPDMIYRVATELTLTHGIPGPRVVYISSPGGYIDVGNMITKMLLSEQQKGTKMVCVVIGNASSAAFNLLSHCDIRLATPESHFTVHHDAVGGLDPEVRWTAKNLRNLADDIDKDDEEASALNAIKMGLSRPDYELYADHERAWTAQELLLMGYLQGFVTADDPARHTHFWNH